MPHTNGVEDQKMPHKNGAEGQNTLQETEPRALMIPVPIQEHEICLSK